VLQIIRPKNNLDYFSYKVLLVQTDGSVVWNKLFFSESKVLKFVKIKLNKFNIKTFQCKFLSPISDGNLTQVDGASNKEVSEMES
jgi:hypothetical protein